MERQLAREDPVEPTVQPEVTPTEHAFGPSQSWLQEMPWLEDDWAGIAHPVTDPEGASVGALTTPTVPAGHISGFTTLDFSTPIDLPSTLVDYWFRHVCPMWSTFDSLENYNRKIPSNTWTTSEPVFYALQAMSAACLADSMPQINSALPSLIKQATTAIQQKMSTFRSAPNMPSMNITIDLVFAVFAMGTSLHWTDNAAQSGDRLLQDAREVLGMWAKNLTAVDAVAHAYFHQALTYWEMLLTVSDESVGHVRLDRKRLDYQVRLRQAFRFEDSDARSDQSPLRDTMPQALDLSSPHPWCGVSSDVIDLFGQVLALCRSSRSRHRKMSAPTIAASSDALCDIGVAHDLQKDLLALNFDDTVANDGLNGITLQTGDEKTPISHLIHVAEAYRQASLIQLYLTFEDLEVKRSIKEHASVGSLLAQLAVAEDAPRAQKLVVMSLQLVAILERIPSDSGSRCIQPVLLILAAAGLRFEKHPKSERPSDARGPLTFKRTNSEDGTSTGPPGPRTDLLEADFPPNADLAMLPSYTDYSLALSTPVTGPVITQATFQVSKARSFVKSRLRDLQNILPTKPMQIASDLVNAIWSEYDGLDCAHWLDVMSDTGLKTMFG